MDSFETKKESPYGPFHMGIQSYSLRNFSCDDALTHTRTLGLAYWEAFPAHIPITDAPEQMAGYKKRLKAAGVNLVAFGVEGFGADMEAARRVLSFARAMGIQVVSADPAPESLSYLAKLAAEHKVLIAIHNHGPGSRYDKIQDVQRVLESQPKQIGACVDTGHYLRSGEDPVEAIRRFGSRVYGVHLKDVKGRTQFTELGKGDLDMMNTLKALQKAKFRWCLALEYEEHPDNPIPYIEECLQVVRESVKRLGR